MLPCSDEIYHTVGSVGSLLAAQLKQHTGQVISLIVRTRSLSRRLYKGFDEQSGITIERDGKQTQVDGFEVEMIPRYRAYTSALQGHPKVDERAIRRAKVEDAEQQRLGPIESLFVTTKAPAVIPALRQLLPRLTPESTIVLLQNGGGLLESLVTQLFPDKTLRPNLIVGINSHGVYIRNTRVAKENSTFDKATHTVWAGLGSIKFGLLPSEAVKTALEGSDPSKTNVFEVSGSEAQGLPSLHDLPGIAAAKGLHSTISAMLACEPLRFEWLPMQDIVQLQQQKIAVNCVINPLTAIFDVQNGVLASNKSIRGITISICQEISAVFAENARRIALAVDSSPTENVTKPILPHHLDEMDRKHLLERGTFRKRHPLSVESLVWKSEDIAKSTDTNVSSTLSDIRKGSFDTEM